MSMNMITGQTSNVTNAKQQKIIANTTTSCNNLEKNHLLRHQL